MTPMIGSSNREVIRVKVKKSDGYKQPEYKKFSIDPQITSFEVLQSLLARAFDVTGDFTVSYLAKDERGQDCYLALLSDWDLDAAFLCASEPCLRLKVDLKPFEDGLDDWDIIAPMDVPVMQAPSTSQSFLASLSDSISTHVGKTVSHVQKVISRRGEDDYKPVKPPMGDKELQNFLDSDGCLLNPQEFRFSVYQGGVEPSLRKVVWRHLLNVFPDGLSGKERMSYLKKKSQEYYKLRDFWRDHVNTNEELKYITNMVKRDVLRTDRTHKFFAGADDNKNIVSLFNILVTYAVTHPEVSYCQGMGDVVSPLLFVQQDEANAYLCFCAIMRRMKHNFMMDGHVMTTKFQHLSLLLQKHDPEFYAYLKHHDADDLFFCYRWLLLELKREFPFNDALYMLEVLWSSIPPDPPEIDLELTGPGFTIGSASLSPGSPFGSKETAYSRLRAMYRRLHPTPSSSNPPPKVIVAGKNPRSPSPQRLGPDSKASTPKGAVRCVEPITPLDESKTLEGSDEYVPVSDPVTKAILAKSASIDKSLVDMGKMGSTTGSTLCNSDVTEAEENSGSFEFPSNELTDTDTSKRELCNDSIENDSQKLCSDSTFGDKSSSFESIGTRNSSSVSLASNCSDIWKGDCQGNSVFFVTLNEMGKEEAQHQGGLSQKQNTNNNNNTQPKDGQRTTQSQNGSEIRQQRPPDIKLPAPLNLAMADTTSLASRDSGINNSQASHSQPETPTKGYFDSGFTDQVDLTSCTDHLTTQVDCASRLHELPPPSEFGCGNPFLVFMCLTLLEQQKETIMLNAMDYNDLAMHFDKMVRKHNVQAVLKHAQGLYQLYLRSQQNWFEESSESVSDFGPSL
ncbi:TBC1 domain family member 25-like isoform X2 [Lingula anatina]|uniref:TBC1 domain family member 25-like isoform X1 n=1 Tax=Lingula anatina TaxID=7574 RepID=A0A1S3JQA9_LINAN|nr:TBC1 domain family member 25-like isoform X1 [Lingula anatina]XP_023931686.1 TBC1 domain family member 25-like isoform X2 [Lingula anatina]|eukprot:XP_013412563.2 TBC1 domain family member 25-like isoform X1 [Lingula anatina]